MGSLPQRLRELRKESGCTQLSLAKKMNRAESTIRMWELGKNEPDHGTLLELSALFDVSVDYLLGQSDQRRTKNNPAAIDEVLEAELAHVVREFEELSPEGIAAFKNFVRSLKGHPNPIEALEAFSAALRASIPHQKQEPVPPSEQR